MTITAQAFALLDTTPATKRAGMTLATYRPHNAKYKAACKRAIIWDAKVNEAVDREDLAAEERAFNRFLEIMQELPAREQQRINKVIAL